MMFKQYVALFRKQQFRDLVVLWLTAYLILLSFFFIKVLNNFNILEVFPKELIFPSVLHAGIALIIAGVIYSAVWLRGLDAKLVAVSILALLFIGYDASLQAIAGPVRAFLPGLSINDPLIQVSFIYATSLGVLSVFIGLIYQYLQQKYGRPSPKSVQVSVLILASYLFIWPATSLFKSLPVLIKESRVQAPQIQKPISATLNPSMPDIYYIVLDRYTNNDVLKTQFGFDNSPFTDYLRDNGFHIKDNAYANYPYTTMSIASTINANYTKEQAAPFKDSATQSRTLYHNMIRQGSVIKALKQSGYEYHHIGSWYGATNKPSLSNFDYTHGYELTIFEKTIKRLRGIEVSELTQGPFYRLLISNLFPIKLVERDYGAGYVREQLNNLDKLASTPKQGGRFIFTHILVPHEPFLFNADGSLSPNSGTDNIGLPIKNKYVNQIQFINSQTKTIVDKILKNSQGQAVILFSSDEGPYPEFMNLTFRESATVESIAPDGVVRSDMTKWTDEWAKMKFGIQQAVHIPKAQEQDLSHLSSVNLFRIVLNTYLGYGLEYLPECHLGVSEGSHKEYIYKDITAKIAGTSSDECRQLESY